MKENLIITRREQQGEPDGGKKKLGKYEKILKDVLSGEKDGNIKFNDLCNLLDSLGVKLQRISGSHHVFAYPGIIELIDLQPDKKDHSKAKNYQVRQVRKFIKQYLEV